MIRAFRLFRSRYAPWDHTGATIRGGRWNSPGTPLLYTSSSLALACLEVIVHVQNPVAMPAFSFCQIDIPDRLVSRLEEPEASAVPESDILSREFGDRWVRSGISRFRRDAISNTIARLAFKHRLVRDLLYRGIRRAEHRPALAVPSAVVPQELNYLLNPEHRDFQRINWHEPQNFVFDRRLLRLSR